MCLLADWHQINKCSFLQAWMEQRESTEVFSVHEVCLCDGFNKTMSLRTSPLPHQNFTTGTLFVSRGWVWVAPGEGCVHNHTIPDIVLHPRGNTGKCHVPTCTVSFTEYWESYTTLDKTTLLVDNCFMDQLGLETVYEGFRLTVVLFGFPLLSAADHLGEVCSVRFVFLLVPDWLNTLYNKIWIQVIKDLVKPTCDQNKCS